MSPRKVPCAGCKAIVSEDGAYMRCKKCKQIYDVFCANIDKDMFDKSSDELKKSWVCVECRSKIPKGDNSHIPVRQQHIQGQGTSSDNPDISMHSPAYVTLRTGARKVCDQNVTNKNILQDMKETVIEELKKIQVDFEEQLVCKISNLIAEQFLSFKTEIFDKLTLITSKVVLLEEQSKLKIDNDRPSEPVQNKKNTKVGSSKRKSDSPAVTLTHAPKKPEGDLPTAGPSVANLSDESTDRDAWEEVRRKRSRAPVPSVLRGTAAPGSTQLQASETRRLVQEGTTSEQVRNHLRSICDGDICTVDELKSRGRYASFKLEVPSKNVDSVMSSENWAENICVKPWRQNFRAKAKSAPSPSPIS
ncbi:hypothetical protein ACJJTC_009190 [Scirpophaga incertulas]